MEFEKGQHVITPDGPGKVDGYGTAVGSNKRTGSLWVWLNQPVAGGTLRPYDPTTVTPDGPATSDPTDPMLEATGLFEARYETDPQAEHDEREDKAREDAERTKAGGW